MTTLNRISIIAIALPALMTAGPAGAASQARAAAEISRPASFADIAEQVNPAVVFVQVTEVGKRAVPSLPFGQGMDFWQFPNSPHAVPEQREFRRQGSGSGFIIGKDGYILTNNHVVKDATKVVVRLSDDREFPAEVKGKDELLDVALIKINTDEDLPTVELGDSDALRVGDWVMAIGNPFVYEHTVTVGVVSHLGRSSGNPFQRFIQTDAAINFGNSGGPLLNTRGEVVGINTAISAIGQGIGFAIPVNRVKEVMLQLKDTGKVTRGFLGVNPQEITEKLQRAFKGLNTRKGALVVEVSDDSPAAEAGLKLDDVIVNFDGRKIDSRADLFHVVGSTPPGKRVAVEVLREEPKGSGRWKRTKLKAKLVERDDQALRTRGGSGEEESAPGEKLGIEVERITPEARRGLQLPRSLQGVVVRRVDQTGAAADSGIERGDVIMQVAGRRIQSVDGFIKAVDELKPGSYVRLRVFRQGAPRYVVLSLPE